MPGNPLDDRSVAATLGQPSDPASVTPIYSAPVAPATLTTITQEEALASLPNALETSLDGLVVLDIAGRPRLLYANAAAHTLLGLPEGDEGAGSERAFWRLFAPRERPIIAERLSSVSVGATDGAASDGWSSVVVADGGAERAIECVPRLVIVDGRRMVSVTLRDVTATRRIARRSTALARVAANTTYAGSLKDTLTQLTRDSVLAAHYAIGIESTDDDILFLEAIARYAASAVENVRLTTDARERAALAERQRVDDALRASEERFRALVEQSPFAIQIFSADGHSLHVNRAYVALWGHTDEWLASTDYNVLDERNYREQNHRDPALLPAIRRAFAGEVVALPLRFFDRSYFQAAARPEGQWIRSSYYPVKDGTGAVREVINIFEDVTARMEAEGRLREREAQYRGIFEATSDGLVITDRRNVVVDVNPAFCRMHGRTRDEFVGQSESIFIHPSRYTTVDESLRAIDERGVYQTEGLDLRGDGRPFPVEVHATSFAYRNEPHVLSVVRDITEQVQARALLERRVSTRTQELSTLLDVAHTVAATLELQPLLDLILDHLKSVVDYTGASINSIENDSLVVLQRRGPVPSDHMQPWRFPLVSAPAIWEIMYRGEPVIIDDVHADTRLAAQYRAVDGQRLETDLRYVRTWMGVPLMLKDRLIGSLTLVSGTIGAYGARDVTLARALAALAAVAIENARLYEQARRIAALEERQRLSRELHDSVSQALYGIALGARTARALIDRDPGKAVEPLDRLAAPLDYVLSLAEAGLAEMRALIFELRPEALERDGLVVALERQAEATRARHTLVIEANLGAEPDAPYAIKEALYRIAQEALHNAAKHARARTIRLRLSSTPRAGGDGIAALELDVEDDGIGFDPGDEYPGHLGLRTMRERAEAFGGVLGIASRPGHGVRLHALVPIDKAGY